MTQLDEEPSLLIENCYEIKEEDAIIPFPKDEVTPPVTNIYFVEKLFNVFFTKIRSLETGKKYVTLIDLNCG